MHKTMCRLTTSNPANWYAVRTHPRQESRVESNLSAMGVETFIPRMKVPRYNYYTDESIHLVKPLFPNYVFARFDLDRLFHPIRFTRGVHSLVSYGTTPALVDSLIITTIQSRMSEDGYVMIGEKLKPGDEVIIERGPWKNLIGIFERETSDIERVMILL